MNRYLIGIVVSALLVIHPSSTAFASATCNCAAQTCVSGGMTWPISSCAECNGVCGSSPGTTGSSSNPWSQPVDSQFLKGKYDIPTPGGTMPLDAAGTLTPIEQDKEKKRKLMLESEALLKEHSEIRRKAAEAAKKAAEEANQKADAALQKAAEAQDLLAAAQKLGTEAGNVVKDLDERFMAAVENWIKLDSIRREADRKAAALRPWLPPPAPQISTAGETTPPDAAGTLTPIEQEKEKKLKQIELLKSEAMRLEKEAEVAEKAVEAAKQKEWEARQKLLKAQDLLARAKKLSTKDKDELVYNMEKQVAAAEENWKKLDLEKQAAMRKAKEAKLKVAGVEVRVEEILKEIRDEEHREIVKRFEDIEKQVAVEQAAAKEARKQAAVAAAKDKLLKLKNKDEVKAAVEEADKKAADKKAAADKAAKDLAALKEKMAEWVRDVEIAQEFSGIESPMWDDLAEEGGKLSADTAAAEEAQAMADKEKEEAELEAAGLREAATQWG